MRTTTTDCCSISLFLLGLFFIFFYFIALPLHFLGLYIGCIVYPSCYIGSSVDGLGVNFKDERVIFFVFVRSRQTASWCVIRRPWTELPETATHRQRIYMYTYPLAHTADRRRTQTRDTYTYNKEKSYYYYFYFFPFWTLFSSKRSLFTCLVG